MADSVIDTTLRRRAVAARWVLVAVGVVFLVSGIIVTSLYLGGKIPSTYDWQGPTFLALGIAGAFTSALGLRAGRRWPVLVLGILYVPWTLIGLLGDTRQGLWPLVVGEAVGLVAVAWAMITWWRDGI
jgi:hypothetical protein